MKTLRTISFLWRKSLLARSSPRFTSKLGSITIINCKTHWFLPWESQLQSLTAMFSLQLKPNLTKLFARNRRYGSIHLLSDRKLSDKRTRTNFYFSSSSTSRSLWSRKTSTRVTRPLIIQQLRSPKETTWALIIRLISRSKWISSSSIRLQ